MAFLSRAVPAVALVVGFGLSAAGQTQKTSPAAKPQAKPAAKAQAANPVLAEINGEPIRANEFRQLLSQFSVPPGREQERTGEQERSCPFPLAPDRGPDAARSPRCR